MVPLGITGGPSADISLLFSLLLELLISQPRRVMAHKLPDFVAMVALQPICPQLRTACG